MKTTPDNGPINYALCGEPLPVGSIECEECSSEPVVSDHEYDEIASIVRRSRGWLFVGSFFLPLLSSLVALRYSSQAMKLYRAEKIADPALEGYIKRTQVAAAVLTSLFVSVILAVVYLQ